MDLGSGPGPPNAGSLTRNLGFCTRRERRPSFRKEDLSLPVEKNLIQGILGTPRGILIALFARLLRLIRGTGGVGHLWSILGSCQKP